MTVQILLAEDSRLQAHVAIEALTNAGYEVKHFLSAEEALESLDGGYEPDIILSDVVMEEIDGTEFCRRVRADPKWNDVPFLMLTSKETFEDQKEGEFAGADDYIVKPLNEQNLLLRVRWALAGKGPDVDEDYVSRSESS